MGYWMTADGAYYEGDRSSERPTDTEVPCRDTPTDKWDGAAWQPDPVAAAQALLSNTEAAMPSATEAMMTLTEAASPGSYASMPQGARDLHAARVAARAVIAAAPVTVAGTVPDIGALTSTQGAALT